MRSGHIHDLHDRLLYNDQSELDTPMQQCGRTLTKEEEEEEEEEGEKEVEQAEYEYWRAMMGSKNAEEVQQAEQRYTDALKHRSSRQAFEQSLSTSDKDYNDSEQISLRSDVKLFQERDAIGVAS